MLEPDKRYLLLKAPSTDYNNLACLAKSTGTKFPELDNALEVGTTKKIGTSHCAAEERTCPTSMPLPGHPEAIPGRESQVSREPPVERWAPHDII